MTFFSGDGDDDEDDDDDDSDDDSSTGRKSKKDDRDDSIGKVIVVETNDKRKNQWFPALVCTKIKYFNGDNEPFTLHYLHMYV